MSRLRIGEVLGRMGKLSAHDIDEILQEQSASPHKFGDIALTWGLVQPEHIWKAWCEQLHDDSPKVDLHDIGVDSQAAARVPASLARSLHAMPVRLFEDELIVAVSEGCDPDLMGALALTLGLKLRFVQADSRQIDQAIERYYPQMQRVPA
jgi:type IV pilus assembly protein PilB